MNRVNPNLLILAGLGAGVALLLLNRDAAKRVGAGAADAAVGFFAGAGETINGSIINPFVAAVSGEPDATLGGKIWDWMHPEEADALRYGVGLDGKPLRRSGGASGSW